MAIEINDLGSTISILNDGEYTIITKQDASIALNGSIVALIDFSGQRYEYNFADVSIPSEASGADLAATLNEYLQTSGGGGGGGVESVTGNVVGGTSTNPTVNIGGNANEILYKNAFGVITSDPDFVRDKAGEWFWQYGRKGSGVTEAITAIQANASVLAPSVVLEASANGGADSSGLQLNKTAPLISGKKANVAYQYNLPTTTPTANQILKANSATPTQLEWADRLPYKVYTALLTQTGATDPQTISTGSLTVGVTYEITDNSGGANFTNVGAPNNTVGTFFVATGTTPTSWGTGELGYNNGAITATVLQNTIGNIWYTYNNYGVYNIKSDGLFINKKTTFLFGVLDGQPGNAAAVVTDHFQNNINNYIFATNDTQGSAGEFLYDTQIEIRVYP
jgi:hypothetical protein